MATDEIEGMLKQRRVAQQNLDRWDAKIERKLRLAGVPAMTPHKREYLFACLSEESGEVTQAVGKIQRFGEHDFHEKTGNIENIELLRAEVNDLIAVAEMLGIVPEQERIKAKQAKVERYYVYACRALGRTP